jgi:hypothetical protein
MRPLCFAILLSVSLAGCGSRDDAAPRATVATTGNATAAPATRQTRADLTLNDFRKLRPEMTLDQVYAQVGKPVRDVGSGIYILEYVLSDGSTVFVGSGGQNILYVRHRALQGDVDLLNTRSELPAAEGRAGAYDGRPRNRGR